MITLKNKKLCEFCFAETDSEVCPECGCSAENYEADLIVLPIGTVLMDRYRIGRPMGKGGFGITYRAYDEKEMKRVAVKEYYPSMIAYRLPGSSSLTLQKNESSEAFESGANKFYDEAKTVSQFNGNPYIVGVYDVFRENSTAYIVMEFLEGMTLSEYVKKKGDISEGEAAFIADSVSRALMIVHSADIIHRDISPDNIMLCRSGHVKIIDFGAAKQNAAGNKTAIVKTGFTPLEQYTVKGNQGPWTDIYSFGATLYFGLTGKMLDSPYERQQDDSEFKAGSGNISDKLFRLIKKAVMINASDRYQDMISLRADLKKTGIAPEAIKLPDEMTDDHSGKTISEKVIPAVTEEITEEAPEENTPVSSDNSKDGGYELVNGKVVKKNTVQISGSKDLSAEKSAEISSTAAVPPTEEINAAVSGVPASANSSSNEEKSKKAKLAVTIGAACAAVAAVICLALFIPKGNKDTGAEIQDNSSAAVSVYKAEENEPSVSGEETETADNNDKDSKDNEKDNDKEKENEKDSVFPAVRLNGPAAYIIDEMNAFYGRDIYSEASKAADELGFNILIMTSDDIGDVSPQDFLKDRFDRVFTGNGVAVNFSRKGDGKYYNVLNIYYSGKCSDSYEAYRFLDDSDNKKNSYANVILEKVYEEYGSGGYISAAKTFLSLLKEHYSTAIHVESEYSDWNYDWEDRIPKWTFDKFDSDVLVYLDIELLSKASGYDRRIVVPMNLHVDTDPERGWWGDDIRFTNRVRSIKGGEKENDEIIVYSQYVSFVVPKEAIKDIAGGIAIQQYGVVVKNIYLEYAK